MIASRRHISLLMPLVIFALLAGLCSTAMAERRVALVIGNGNYKNASPLGNPANDASAMAEALEKVGFELVGGKPLLDLDKNGMEQAINEFGTSSKGADVTLFYYSGHGVQVDGANYLIPVTASVDSRRDVKYQLVDANFVLDEMQNAGTGTNIVILDACRNNPFGGTGMRSAAAGLAHMDAPKGTLIAYSTAPGQTARDGDGKNSPYTQALARHIADPCQRVEDVFIKVRQEVDQATEGAQSPWEASNLYSTFYFVPPQPGAAAVDPSSPAAASLVDKETALWQSIVAVNDAALFEDYLTKYPDGEFATVAKAKIERIKAQQGKTRDATGAPATPKPGEVFHDKAAGMDFVWVPAGCYNMGSPDAEQGRYDDEGPQHEVCVDGFWMGKTTVTNAQFRQFRAGHDSRGIQGHSLNGDNQPAVYVSWDDATAYAVWLSTKGGGSYRLPTEAEWEYAARAGTATSRYWGDNPADACGFENVWDKKAEQAFDWQPGHACDDGHAATAPVGSYKPNPFGLQDMLGNNRQWCQDNYGERAYERHQKNNPLYVASSQGRVNRGGSWSAAPKDARAARRYGNTPSDTSSNLGFRLVRQPQGAKAVAAQQP